MADRYYIPAEQAIELSQILESEQDNAPELVASVRRIVFATPIPEDIADELERSLENAATGLSL